jgi:serine/threonine protein kinase
LVPPDPASQLDSVCRAFDAAWTAGERPRLESYLRDVLPPLRGPLFCELLRLDLSNRWRKDEKPTPEEYYLRFPADVGLVQAIFRDAPTAAGTPAAGPATAARATELGRSPSASRPTIPGYEILGELEPGGMGVVYRARHAGHDHAVALKMIRAGIHADAQELARFRIEADAIASLSHPHIIQIHEYGEWRGMPYLAMELAEGGSLARRLGTGPMATLEAAELVECLARTVQFIHERGILHRDLKPANVLLTPQGVPKLADFGLAKRLDQDQGLTRTQAVLGTASYMAPEQAAGDKHALGPATDIYGLGAILYELLTGRPPFLAETRELTIHQVLSEEPRPPTQWRAGVPPALEAICLKCLEKEAALRYPSALALADDLSHYQRGEPISIPNFGLFERHARAARRIGYELLEVLKTGALGPVYKGRQVTLNRPVVLAMLTGLGRLEASELDQLRARAEGVAQLQHPNIVQLYDAGELHGEPFVTREYVEGSSLTEGLAGPPQPAAQAAALLETLARAVHHAHLRGIVHGSLKPSKILLGTDGARKITGFGQAEVFRVQPALFPFFEASDGESRSAGLSPYLAPEQAADPTLAISPAMDVYALGAILYELLAGHPPPTGAAPEPPRSSRPEVPRELEAICLKCLDHDPAARYPSAAALAEDLRRFRTGEVLFVDDLDERSQQQRWARRAGYEILELLGQGRDGFTYKARQLAFDRVVVLKRLAAAYRFVPAAKDRFRWEARLLARLGHPNIVQLYDQGEQNDLAYFAREFVEGPSLDEFAAEVRRPAPAETVADEEGEDLIWEAAEIVAHLARALQTAHAHGIIHGGLNSANVRLTLAGAAKITRFRRAWLPSSSEEGQPESDFRRLAAYLAPEQLEGRRTRLSPATDVYALGAILYTLLTGQAPFVSPTLDEMAGLARSHVPAPLQHFDPAIPPELEALCLRCLEKQPGHRPVSAEAVAEELRRIIR